MKANDTNYINTHSSMLALFLFGVTLSKYNVQVGFSLKPYMFFLFVALVLNFTSFYFTRLYGYEVALLVFYFFYSLSGAFSLYQYASIRIILGIVLIILCYFIMRSLIYRYTRDQIEAAIAYAGIWFNVISLALYIWGIKRLDFQFNQHEISAYGVLVDRGYPRLIGLLDDPNIYIFYNTIFLFYFLCNHRSIKNKCGLVLSVMTCILTFSRGGLFALILVFIIYVVISKGIRRLQLILQSICLLIVAYIVAISMKFDILNMLNQRLEDFQRDGGSGRFDLWNRGFTYFLQHPFKGIGAFNFSEYNLFFYGEKLYAHNTFIEILAESGIFIFCLYLLFLFFLMWELLTSKLYKEVPYLLLIPIAFFLQMMSLSLVVNEMIFVYLAILCSYMKTTKTKEWVYGKRVEGS
jgi:hypothetical protein